MEGFIGMLYFLIAEETYTVVSSRDRSAKVYDVYDLWQKHWESSIQSHISHFRQWGSLTQLFKKLNNMPH